MGTLNRLGATAPPLLEVHDICFLVLTILREKHKRWPAAADSRTIMERGPTNGVRSALLGERREASQRDMSVDVKSCGHEAQRDEDAACGQSEADLPQPADVAPKEP